MENVSFSYRKGTSAEVKAVKNLSLSVSEGQFVALAGRNGSGKSTVARLLNGLLLPDEGTVEVDGFFTNNKKSLFDIRSRLGVVFQNPDNQTVATIIEDDVAFGPENLGLKPELIRQRVDWALKSVGMYEHREGTPFRLSGGQKQRVAIAGVLALKPKIMVLDESTSMLDPIGRAEVLKVVKDLNKNEKMTVIMITHFMEEAALADRIIVMDGGEAILDGGAEIFQNEHAIVNAGLQPPFAARLCAKLRARGVPVGESVCDIESLAGLLA